MDKDGDEEIVTVVETDMRSVVAVQYLIGPRFGKGNLIHMDLRKRISYDHVV
jgi:formylmethanofuran dehydrogenase subunit E